MPAASRTVRVSTPSIVAPAHASPTIGPRLSRARVGLSPTRPHALDGMRMDPPPSLPCATATMPLATAAADPPEEPPAERPGSQGLRAAGKLRASVLTVVPISRTLVRPCRTKPAARTAAVALDSPSASAVYAEWRPAIGPGLGTGRAGRAAVRGWSPSARRRRRVAPPARSAPGGPGPPPPVRQRTRGLERGDDRAHRRL